MTKSSNTKKKSNSRPRVSKTRRSYRSRRNSTSSTIIKRTSEFLKNKKVRSGFLMLLPSMLLVTIIVSLLISKKLRKKISDKFIGDMSNSAITKLNKIQVYFLGAIEAGEQIAEEKNNKNIFYYIDQLNPVNIIIRLFKYIKNNFFKTNVTIEDSSVIAKDLKEITDKKNKKEYDHVKKKVENITNATLKGVGKSIGSNDGEIENVFRFLTKNAIIGTTKGAGDVVSGIPRALMSGLRDIHKKAVPYFFKPVEYNVDDFYSPPSTTFHTPRESLSYLNGEELNKFINKTSKNEELSIFELAAATPKILNV